MADELTISASLSYLKGRRSFSSEGMGFSGVLTDVTGTDITFGTQTIGTSIEALNLGDLAGTTPGYMICKNLSTTASNNIHIRSGSGGANVVKLRPLGIALFELDTTTPYAIADNVSAELLYCIIEF